MPEWKVGDCWEYESPYYSVTFKERVEVINITTINVSGIDYDVYVVLTTSATLWANYSSYDYFLTSDMSTVRTETILDYGLNQTGQVTTYQPPLNTYDFPLYVGKTWTSSAAVTRYDDALGHLNHTENPVYEVTQKETITVKAGTFECYIIEVSNVYGGGEKRIWYSPEVKKPVKIEEIYRITTTTELTFYSDEGQDEDEFAIFLIFFLILLIVAIVISILLANRLKKEKGDKAEPEDAQQQVTTDSDPVSSTQHSCPTCSSPLSYIQQYDRWYCPGCEKYL